MTAPHGPLGLRTAAAGSLPGVRRLMSPGWVTVHVVVVVGTLAMLWLGFWQWTGGLTGHTARNTGYALQWFVFAAFAIFFWIKLMRDAVRGDAPAPPTPRAPLGGRRRPEAPAPAGYRGYQMKRAPVVADDSELGRYNAYLASLQSADAAGSDAAGSAAAVEPPSKETP